MCKSLGVSLHAVSNGGAQSVLPAAVLPAYSTMPMMSGFMAAPPHATHPPSSTTHIQSAHATNEWNQYYYVSNMMSMVMNFPLETPYSLWPNSRNTMEVGEPMQLLYLNILQ